MKITTIALAFFCLCSYATLGQTTYSVKGAAIDSASNVKLQNTSISVLNAKDSTLRKFTRATANGSFAINGLSKGKFIILMTYPGYADYVEHFTLDSVKTQFNVGNVNMLLKSRLLNEVLVKGEVAAIKIKGDTTEFNAKAFKIQPNSKVEDLLKQLPGIQVDKDGKITAQGQTVTKVLVDGEEFFGDDPTLVTKNIRGDMVDKVQLYDKKSDQSTFTGIDDGEKTKTINIKLKEDKKNGYFGKIDAGIGTNGYYQGQALYNRFKGKKKFSAYGTLSNTGKTGLGWEDANKLGTSNMQMTDDGGMYFSSGGDEFEGWGGRYNGEGIPVARTGGLHYDDKWKNDKYILNTNYKIGSLSVVGKRNTLSQQSLPGDTSQVINTVTDEKFDNYIFRQKLDATYTVKLDTTSSLKVSVDGTLKNSDSKSDNLTTSRRADQSLLNENSRSLTNNADQQLFNASALYTKRLKKPGRTLSLSVIAGITESKGTGFLKSRLNLYDTTGRLDSTKTQFIDQFKTNNTKTSKLNTNLTYTEPLSKALSMILSYGINLNNSNSDRKSFDQSTPGNYNVLNDSLSNHYIFNQTSNRGGLNFNYKKGKSLIRFGTYVANIHYQQTDEITGLSAKRNFTNWNPQANYQYRFSTYGSLSAGYNGSQTQPTIDQLQPIRVNTDPLNLIIGNPNLKPSFNHRFNANYNSYKVLSGQSIWAYGSYGFTVNPIVANTATDLTQGKSVTQSINLNDKRQSNYYGGASLNKKVTAWDMNIGLNLNTDGNIYYSMVNGEINRTNSSSYTARLSMNKSKQKKYEIYLNFGPDYTIGQSSLQPDRNNNGRGWNGGYGFTIYLPGKIQVGSDGEYNYKAPTQSFNEDFSQAIINATITKAFMKDETLKLQIRGNDLLNQNSGFTRSASSNYITQTNVTTIRRYFMFSLIWDFNKMGGGAPAKK
jgi:hypothetical protein